MKIDWATHEAAKYACEHWHYSKCIPKSKLVKIGVWENDCFIGAVIFGLGANPNLCKPYQLNMTEVCELVRISLRKHQNPVSKILSIAIKFLKKTNPGLKLIVSFADPNQNHHGGIYQATNWIYTGKTAPDVFFLDPKGKLWHPRRASKNKRSGKKLVSHGWIEKVQLGKHRYVMPLDHETFEKVQKLKKPYPKRVSSVESGTSGFQLERGGESPTDTLQLNEINNGKT